MEPAATWIGHASVLLQLGGISLLTDPVFSERASPVSFAGPRREGPPGIAAADLPRIDAVVVSHNHYDHLDAASVKALAAQPGGSPLFVVPLGLKDWFTDAGIERVVELDWWQSTKVGEAEIVLVPAQHWSGRSLDRPHGDAVGRLRRVRPRLPGCSSPATPATRRTSPTSTPASPPATAARTAASTWPCCRSAPTSRAGS